MIIDFSDNTHTTNCPCCGIIEVISLVIKGTGLHCRKCLSHCGYVPDLEGTGIERCHLIEL